MENIVADFTISNENTINAEYSIEQDDFDCSFEIFASGTVWGAITGNITDQTDLINILNEKATISYVDTNIQSEATSRAESDTLLQNNINTLSGNLTSEINARTLADNNLQTQIDNINTAGYITKDVNDLSYYMLTTDINTALNGKQNTISDLADIRNNAENGNTAYNTIQNYGDIVTYNADNFATANQGALADTSIQPNDNITLLNNDAGYITSASLPTVNNSTITIQKNGATVESFNLNQADNETINITVPTDTNDLTNGAGFITSADLPTLADLTTPAQMNAINSGATSTNIGQIATNTQAISTETLNRQNADNNLQSQIDAIVSSSDVYDIVGTYAELQAYDISTVPVNDIIKVLVDSTHNNSATYYRCIETNNVKSWSYIGSEGAYYTKSEADARFVTNTSLTTILTDYVLSSDLSTTLANYVTSANLTTILDDYATKQWVNNQGYITGITSSDVTTALGFTPYNATNPNGYITSSALTPYALISSLSTVATSGLYSDLTGLPTIPTMTSQLTNNSGFITSADLPTNYLTTNTAQDVSGRKTFLGEKAIYFKQIATSNKLGFTLYNPSNTELGALEYRPNTIGSASLLALNCPQATGGYVGFRYWGTPAVNIIAPKVATAGNYYIPTHITNGTSTVTASNNGTVNISTLLPTVGNGTITINQGGTQKGTFTVNQSGDTTINLDAGGGTVDQTFDGTSANAQSGVAISNAKFIQNTATGTNALTLLGTATSGFRATNIGYGSTASGYQATALGCDATASIDFATALGYNAKASNLHSVALGTGADASGYVSIALGHSAIASKSSAIQIGHGTNSTANTLNIGFDENNTNWQLLDGTTGLIPDARISSNIARTSNVANTNLSNLSTTGKRVIDGQWVSDTSNIVSSNITVTTSYSNNWSLASYLPNDNYNYEVLFSIYGTTAPNSGATLDLRMGTDLILDNNNEAGVMALRGQTRTNSTMGYANCLILPVGTNRKVYIKSYGTGVLSVLRVQAYRRLGTNS